MTDVEVSVSVCTRDIGFFELTYRHLAHQLGRSSASRRIVVDRSVGTGRFAGAAGSPAELDAALRRLRQDALVDEVTDVDWTPATVARVMETTFGDADQPTRCANGTAIYQYLYGIDVAEAPYVLHVDDDLLYHLADGGRWVDEGIELMRSDPRVVLVTPDGGPPMAGSVREWIVGRPTSTPTCRWQVAETVSTRIFLLDRKRFYERVLPLVTGEHGEPLERSLTETLARRGLRRCSLIDAHNWAIHPRRHNENHRRYLAELIEVVEGGRAPFRRTGFQWDLRTEGRHFAPWWLAVQRQRVGRRFDSWSRAG